jgi:hypothetical protein
MDRLRDELRPNSNPSETSCVASDRDTQHYSVLVLQVEPLH